MDSIEAILPDSRVVNHNGRITALVNFGTVERFTVQKYEELEALIASFELRCGMSRPFTDMEELHWHYQSAIDAAAFGRYSVFIDPSILDSRINYFERCETYVMVHHAMERGVDLNRFIHPFATRLYEHDRDHDTNYLRTLYEYIRTPKKAQAAEALFIHRNTLDYRLKKILELIPFSRDDGETLSRIYLSSVILFYLEAREEYGKQKGLDTRGRFSE